MKPQIHPTAKVHPSCVIYDNVIIEKDVEIGPFCIIGAPAEKKGNSYNGGVHIKEGAKLKGFNSVDSGAQITTVIGKGTWLLKHAHVGHDAYLGDNCTISCGAKIGGHAILDNHVNIALNASVHQFVKIPTGVMVGMNSCVTKKLELEPFSIYAGVPARYIKENEVLKNRL